MNANAEIKLAAKKPTIVGKNKQILLALITIAEKSEFELESILNIFGLNTEILQDSAATNEIMNAKSFFDESQIKSFAEMTGTQKKARKPKTAAENGETKKPRAPRKPKTADEVGETKKTRAPRKPKTADEVGETKKPRAPRSDRGKRRLPDVEVVPEIMDEYEAETAISNPAGSSFVFIEPDPELQVESELVVESEPEPVKVQPPKRKYNKKSKD